jgi:hypothetical protein
MSLTVIALTRDVSQDMFPSFEIFIGLFSLVAKRKNNNEMMDTEYVSRSQFLTARSLLALVLDTSLTTTSPNRDNGIDSRRPLS